MKKIISIVLACIIQLWATQIKIRVESDFLQIGNEKFSSNTIMYGDFHRFPNETGIIPALQKVPADTAMVSIDKGLVYNTIYNVVGICSKSNIQTVQIYLDSAWIASTNLVKAEPTGIGFGVGFGAGYSDIDGGVDDLLSPLINKQSSSKPLSFSLIMLFSDSTITLSTSSGFLPSTNWQSVQGEQIVYENATQRNGWYLHKSLITMADKIPAKEIRPDGHYLVLEEKNNAYTFRALLPEEYRLASEQPLRIVDVALTQLSTIRARYAKAIDRNTIIIAAESFVPIENIIPIVTQLSKLGFSEVSYSKIR